VSLFADAERRRVIYVAERNEAATVEAFAANLRTRGKPSQIEVVSIDMWPAFIRGVTDHLPNAQITFDKFHVIAPHLASWHVQNGTPLHVLQELGGWETPSMVRRYAHFAPDHLAAYAGKVELTRTGTNPSQQHPV
jgi:Transposase